jgi:transposase
MSKNMSGVIVGVDVSKESVDVCFLDQEENAIKNQSYPKEKYPALVKNLGKCKPKIVVMEATGGYEKELAVLLANKKLPFRILNPTRVRKFADAIGKLCKTDKVDALVLALYAKRNSVDAAELPDENQMVLRELVERRRQLVSMRAMEKTRLQTTSNQMARTSIIDVVRHLDKQISDIDKQLDRFVDSNTELREKEELLSSVPGVGTVTARVMLSQLPELGHVNRQSAAALAGVAPYERQSGQFRGRSMIFGGRKEVRNALYMATLSAKKHNPLIRDFYQRLITAGKKVKVALTACMRKLLLQMNSVLKEKNLFTHKKLA